MLRFDFILLESSMREVQKYFANDTKQHITSLGYSSGINKYKYLYKLEYGTSAIIVGLGFNGYTKEDNYKCFMEFNPNKVFSTIDDDNVDASALNDFNYIIHKSVSFRLVRWDLAIDIPIDRGLVQMVKDKRKYALSMHSENDKTEYLGSRNKSGFVKLYNKTVESKLDYDLTRLEITCDSKLDSVGIHELIPKLWVMRYQNEIDFNTLQLSEKDRLLVELLRLHPDYFSKLNYRNRLKFQEYVFGANEEIGFSLNCIRKLIERIKVHEK